MSPLQLGLRLYVLGESPSSTQAVANLREVLADELAGRAALGAGPRAS